jgi:hypothetical protein
VIDREAEVVPLEMPWTKAGMSHTEFTFRDAIENFRNAKVEVMPSVKAEQLRCGVANVAHAWYVAVTDGGLLDSDEARALFNELTRLAGAWE